MPAGVSISLVRWHGRAGIFLRTFPFHQPCQVAHDPQTTAFSTASIFIVAPDPAGPSGENTQAVEL